MATLGLGCLAATLPSLALGGLVGAMNFEGGLETLNGMVWCSMAWYGMAWAIQSMEYFYMDTGHMELGTWTLDIWNLGHGYWTSGTLDMGTGHMVLGTWT